MREFSAQLSLPATRGHALRTEEETRNERQVARTPATHGSAGFWGYLARFVF